MFDMRTRSPQYHINPELVFRISYVRHFYGALRMAAAYTISRLLWPLRA